MPSSGSWMLNVVVGKNGHPSAILIRGAGDISGPGRLTKQLKIDKRLNNKAVNKKSGLWLEFSDNKNMARVIKKAPRIGVKYAGSTWAKKPWRYVLVRK